MTDSNDQKPDFYQRRRKAAVFFLPIILIVWICAYLYYRNQPPAYAPPQSASTAPSIDNVKKVVALTPSLTETFWALNPEPSDYKLVATSPFTQDPRAQNLLRLDSAGSLEQIVALRPALVLQHPVDSRLREQLESMHIPTLSYAMDTLEDIDRAITDIAEHINQKDRAEILLDIIHRDLKRNAEQFGANKTPRDILIIVDRLDARLLQFYTAQAPAYLADLVEGCGYKAIQVSSDAWARISAEQLIELNPERILFIAHDIDDAEFIHSEMRKLYPTLQAVTQNRLFLYYDGHDKPKLTVPGPNIADAQYSLCSSLEIIYGSR